MKIGRIKVLYTILCFIFSCSIADATCTDPRELIKSAKDPAQKTILIAMHRGVWGEGTRLPENSMGAFVAADRMCMGAIETDVRLTSDKVPVLLHDKTFGRTTNVFKYIAQEKDRFYPETGLGYNPSVTDVPWTADEGPQASALKLLVEPNNDDVLTIANVTGYGIETVKSFYDEYLNNRLSLVVFLEIKDKNAVAPVLRQLFSDHRDYLHHLGVKPLHATEFTVIKFNANMFPTAKDYRDALAAARKEANAPESIPDPLGFPAYASNTLQQLIDNNPGRISDPYTDSIKTWVDDDDIRIGIELNLKEKDGILQEYYDKARQTGKVTIGTFHAEPDFLRVNPKRGKDELLPNLNDQRRKTIKASDAFYQGETGACCYQLTDMLGTIWQGKRDNSDKRPDAAFVVGGTAHNPGFRIITTDNLTAIVEAAMAAKLEPATLKSSLLRGDEVFYSSSGNDSRIFSVTYNNFGPLMSTVTDLQQPISTSPAVGTLNGDTYLFFQPRIGDVAHINYRVRDKNGWSEPNSTKLPYLSRQPSAAVFNGALYVFGYDWVNHRIMYAHSRDGQQWGQVFNVQDRQGEYIKIYDDPAATVYNGKLYLFFKGDDPLSNYLMYTTFDGVTWTPVEKVPNAKERKSPSVVPLNGKLYVFHHNLIGLEHENESENVNERVYCSIFDGLSWNANNEIPGMLDVKGLGVTANQGQLKLYYPETNGQLARIMSSDCKRWFTSGAKEKPPIVMQNSPVVLP